MTGQAIDHDARARLALRQVVPLRWLAVAGGMAALPAVWWLLPHRASAAIVAGLVAVTAASNLWLARRLAGPPRAGERLAGAVLALDAVCLAAGLAATGGPHNPFALVYAIPVAVAAMAGGPRLAWLVSGLAVAGYAASFRWHLHAPVWDQPIAVPGAGTEVPVHLLGMWIAMVFVAVFTAAFVQRIMRVLAQRELALRDAQARLSHTGQLAALTALAGGAAHELGSPLGTVAIVARELERMAEREGQHAIARDATLIRDEVERCREILDRMARAVRSGGAGSTSPDDLWDLLSAELGDEIARIRLEHEPGARVEALPIPAIQLAPLLLPLLRNALDATPPGPGGPPVELRVARTDEGVRVDVRDAGTGMAPDVLERATEPFFTTKAERGGAGLGLHLVQLVSEALGGRLTLESAPGRGTRATLLLRAAAGG